MNRWIGVLVACCLALVFASTGWATSDQAMKLRSEAGLVPFTPSETFLSANFIADEVDPAFIFRSVGDFKKTLSCPATWLIEEGEQARLAAHKTESGPFEYSLILEVDCGTTVSHYVFIDRSLASAQWLEWRKQFHKSKAEPQYGQAKAGLEQAVASGVPVAAEFRFIEVNGELQLKKPEDVLLGELKVKPVYDLRQGKALSP